MLMRFDPFRPLDRLTDELFEGQRRAPRSFPMDTYRRGDHVLVHFDLPGVQKDTIELTVERNVLTLKAERRFEGKEGDELVANERQQGTFTRSLFLGDTLDSDNVSAEYEDGVLSLTIPVAGRSKPRRVEIARKGGSEPIESAAPAGGEATPPAAGTADPGKIERTAPGPRP